jgi:hypothetical protein
MVAVLGIAIVLLGGVITAVLLRGKDGSPPTNPHEPENPVSPAAAARADRHAGIEIGSTGIKTAVLTLARDGDGYKVQDVHSLKPVNVAVGGRLQRPGRQAEEATQEAVEELARIAGQLQGEFHVPREQIYVIGGSSLLPSAGRDSLARAVEQRIGRPVRFLGQAEETEYLIQGAIPQRHRAVAVLIDLGSGSLKCGYWEEGGRFSVVRTKLPGARTFAAEVKKQARGAPFANLAASLSQKLIADPLSDEVMSRPGFQNRDYAYLSGGTVWVLTTLLHPDACDKYFVPLTVDDFEKFRALLLSKPNTIPRPDLSAIHEEEARKLAESEVRAARDLLNYEQLLAGTEILRAVARAFHLRGKQLFFSRVALHGWIMAYVERNAAGRSRPAPP